MYSQNAKIQSSPGSTPGISLLVVLRIGLVATLCALIAGLGAGSYTLLSNVEIQNFSNQFQSLANNIAASLDGSLADKIAAAAVVNSTYRTAMSYGYVDKAPNITLPGYESLMDGVIKLASLRSLQFAPLVTATKRQSWEAYARTHVSLLQGPPSLTASTNGSWTVDKGIFNFTPDRKRKVSGKNSIPGSTHPDWLFPLWQIAPIAPNAGVVMLDVHEQQVPTVDLVIATGRSAVTDLFQLSQDGAKLRPSTIMYSPIQSPLPGDNNRIVGLSAAVFTWDEMFANAVPSFFGRVYCVLKTEAKHFTFAIDGGAVTVLGTGDLHETGLDKFRISLSVPSFSAISAPDYTFELYPSTALYNQYVTATPRNACIVVVFLIVFTALVVVLYSYYVSVREKQLVEEVKHAAVAAASNKAILESKKMYVRYISHEIRTPMNAASLGIELLTQNLSRAPDGEERDANLETLDDMRNSFDMALAILDDLLNFDKLESGNFTIEPTYVVARDYFEGCLKMSKLPAREKNVKLVLDIAGLCSQKEQEVVVGGGGGGDETISPEMKMDDIMYIDKYKMDQVIRNLVSNAIKFTPAHKTVTVRVRRDDQILLSDAQQVISDSPPHGRRSVNNPIAAEGRQSEPDVEMGSLDTGLGVGANSFADGTVHRSRRKPQGTLILDVIDEGVGIDPENIKKLFKEVVQFNPGKLQAGGGSGLGMMISKGIVDMHGGELSVSSEGEGKGTTFTLKLPLYHGGLTSQSNSLKYHATPRSDNFSTRRVVMNDSDADQDKAMISSREIKLKPNISSRQSSTRNGAELDGSRRNIGVGIVNTDAISLKLLVVDDSKLNRRMLLRLLEAEGHHCDEAEDGEEAVEMVKQRTYDVILMDFVMPKMDGPTASKMMRDQGYIGAIFGVTGNVLSEDINTFLTQGANQVLVKPIDANGLRAAFAKHGLVPDVSEC